MCNRIQLQWTRFKTIRAYKSGDWRKIPIQETGNPLVQGSSEYCYPYYNREMNLVADERIFLRQEVLERFIQARKIVRAQGFDLIVYDGWRSIELQENLFWYYMREFTAARFNRQDEFARLAEFSEVREYFATLPPDMQTALREANRTYVSWPSNDPQKPSPHATGGSIDVWLYKDGAAADLGDPL